MRFNIKDKPELGSVRIKKRFAFFPVTINKNLDIWLETYYTLETYCQDVFAGQKRTKYWATIRVSLDPQNWENIPSWIVEKYGNQTTNH